MKFGRPTVRITFQLEVPYAFYEMRVLPSWLKRWRS